LRFTLFAAVGAASLGVIFGALELTSLILMALSAAFGALVRRWLSGVSGNPLIQPLSAAAIAGVVASVAGRLQLSDGIALEVVRYDGDDRLVPAQPVARRSGSIPSGLFAGTVRTYLTSNTMVSSRFFGTSVLVASQGRCDAPVCFKIDPVLARTGLFPFDDLIGLRDDSPSLVELAWRPARRALTTCHRHYRRWVGQLQHHRALDCSALQDPGGVPDLEEWRLWCAPLVCGGAAGRRCARAGYAGYRLRLLAKGYGVEGVLAATADDLKQALTAALGSLGPTLIEVTTLNEGF
jgi:hypothetical protein